MTLRLANQPGKEANNVNSASWAVLVSHTKDFTPVCSTELGYKARIKHEIDQAWRLSSLEVGWSAPLTDGGKRHHGSGVAQIIFRWATVAASAITNFAKAPPALTERPCKRPSELRRACNQGRVGPEYRCTRQGADECVCRPVPNISVAFQAHLLAGVDLNRDAFERVVEFLSLPGNIALSCLMRGLGVLSR